MFRNVYVPNFQLTVIKCSIQDWKFGALLLCPCLFRPSDSVWRSRRADTPLLGRFSTVISPYWITEQISVGKCAHRGVSARQERQSSFKIVTWTKQTWTKHHNTEKEYWSLILCVYCKYSHNMLVLNKASRVYVSFAIRYLPTRQYRIVYILYQIF